MCLCIPNIQEHWIKASSIWVTGNATAKRKIKTRPKRMLALSCSEQSVLQSSLGWFVSAITWRSVQDKAVCLWAIGGAEAEGQPGAAAALAGGTHLGRRHCRRTWWAFSQWELALRRWRICDSGPFLVSELPNLSLLHSCNCTLDHVLPPAWSQCAAHLGYLKKPF